MFKKAPFFPSQPRRAKTRLSAGKAAGPLARGAYTGVREYDKGPRTPLADFFNILLDRPDPKVKTDANGQTLIFERENRIFMKSGNWRWNPNRGKVVDWDARADRSVV